MRILSFKISSTPASPIRFLNATSSVGTQVFLVEKFAHHLGIDNNNFLTTALPNSHHLDYEYILKLKEKPLALLAWMEHPLFNYNAL